MFRCSNFDNVGFITQSNGMNFVPSFSFFMFKFRSKLVSITYILMQDIKSKLSKCIDLSLFMFYILVV